MASNISRSGLVGYTDEEVSYPVFKVFADLGPIKQYAVGAYRIDLYFSSLKVAIECDEADHTGYDKKLGCG